MYECKIECTNKTLKLSSPRQQRQFVETIFFASGEHKYQIPP